MTPTEPHINNNDFNVCQVVPFASIVSEAVNHLTVELCEHCHVKEIGALIECIRVC